MKEYYNYEIKENDLKDIFTDANNLVKKALEEKVEEATQED
jgi:cell fate (sporulation/competence/biofilm development) regulator YlbF (YheA/YmcA/DUF963 family)